MGAAEERRRLERRRYDREHRKLREQLLPAAYGQPCPLCGELMLRGQELHLDHRDDGRGYRGIVHAWCNMSEGGKLRWQRARARERAKAPLRTSRDW